MTARAQSRDRLVTWMICPLGVVMTSPLTVRRRVTRRVTSSTVPVTGCVTPEVAMVTTSPKPYCRSPVMKNPAPMSCTNRCRPNPSAALSSAAGATRPARGTPSSFTISAAVTT